MVENLPSRGGCEYDYLLSIPIHRQPAYANLGLNEGSLPETEELAITF